MKIKQFILRERNLHLQKRFTYIIHTLRKSFVLFRLIYNRFNNATLLVLLWFDFEHRMKVREGEKLYKYKDLTRGQKNLGNTKVILMQLQMESLEHSPRV